MTKQASALAGATRVLVKKPAIILAAIIGATATVAASASAINIATQSQGSVSYAAGSAVATVLADQLGVRTRVQPTAGISVLLPMVSSGEVEGGMANVLEAAEAYKGEGRQREQPNLRTAGVLYPINVGLFVRADSGIKSLSDLKGRRVTHGFTAMGSSAVIVDALLANGGLTANDVRRVTVPNVVRGADDFAAGRADAFFFVAGGAGKVAEVEASVGKLRLLPLDESPEAMARTQQVFAYGYVYQQEPAGNVPGIDSTTATLAYDQLLVVHDGLDEERVYRITKALAENKEGLARANWQYNRFDRNLMYKQLPVPYHPGAIRYFEEQGLSQISQ